jgi:hypothetical protein
VVCIERVCTFVLLGICLRLDAIVSDRKSYCCGVMGQDLYGVLLFNCGRGLLSGCSERDLAKTYSPPIAGAHP